jgi:hypothetical protein
VLIKKRSTSLCGRSHFDIGKTVLHRNKLCLKPTVSDDDVFDFIVAVTADEFPKKSHGLSADDVTKQIAWWIKNNSEQARINFGNICVLDFIEKCKTAGAQYKFAGGHVLMNHKAMVKGKPKSIKLSNSTRQLNGPTAAAYVRKLGLNAATSGIDSNEFYDGAKVERAVSRRYVKALRRPAKT